MLLKNICIAATCALLLGCGVASAEEAYRPDQFLRLDLPMAVLSPKRLGPAAEFEPLRVEARSDRDSEALRTAEPTSEPRLHMQGPRLARLPVETVRAHAEKPRELAEKPRGVARTRLAHRHGNPLDAQAFDTRVQVWPCKSGGICSWKR